MVKNEWHHHIPWLQKQLHRRRHQKHHPIAKWFSSKVMVKNVFLQNGCQ